MLRTASTTGEEFIPGSPDLVLQARGLDYLLDLSPPLVPIVTEQQIRDYGKADSLAKLLACLQAVYLVVVCISRLACRLPISQLEVNTGGHALCALAIYAFWFRKPKDVNTVTVITDSCSASAAAFLFSLSSMDRMFGLDWLGDVCRVCNRVEHISEYFQVPLGQSSRETAQGLAAVVHLSYVQATMFCPWSYPPPRHLQPLPIKAQLECDHRCWRAFFLKIMDFDAYDKACRSGIDAAREHKAAMEPESAQDVSEYVQGGEGTSTSTPSNVADCWTGKFPGQGIAIARVEQAHLANKRAPLLDGIFVRRLSLIAKSIEGFPKPERCNISNRSGFCKHAKDLTDVFGDYMGGVALESTNWPSAGALNHDSSSLPPLVIAFSTISYAGLHATAWQSHFPTPVETHLWRTSLLILGSSGLLFSLRLGIRSRGSRHRAQLHVQMKGRASQPFHMRALFDLYYFVETILQAGMVSLLLESRPRRQQKWPHTRGTKCARVVVWILAVLFFSSRTYIVIEAFISLRSLPPEMYQTPQWPNWLPHL